MNSKGQRIITGVIAAALFLMISFNLKSATRFLHTLNEIAEQQLGDFAGFSPAVDGRLSSLLIPINVAASADSSNEAGLILNHSDLSDTKTTASTVEADIISCLATRPDASPSPNKDGKSAPRKQIRNNAHKSIRVSPANVVFQVDLAANIMHALADASPPVVIRETFVHLNHHEDLKNLRRMQRVSARGFNNGEKEFVFTRTRFDLNSNRSYAVEGQKHERERVCPITLPAQRPTRSLTVAFLPAA